MKEHHKMNYVEYPAKDLAATKRFFTEVFGWEFVDYGPEYTAFSHQGLDGGFYASELKATTHNGSALIVFYSTDLATTLAGITAAGGEIVRPVYTFPGGRRFHFVEPSGNEFAVWSDLV